MSLYETMFNQYDIATSQLLVTSFDFTSPERRRNIQYVISQLLALGIVPLLNENDAVSANQGYQTFGNSFSDNDSLAALVAVEMSAQLLVLLTDVNGVYDRPPNDPQAKLIDVFDTATEFKVGDKSLQGRGGMGAKVNAALTAVNGGVQAVIIAAGNDSTVIDRIMTGEKAGTLFLAHLDGSGAEHGGSDRAGAAGSGSAPVDSTAVVTRSTEDIARGARTGSRQLQALTTKEREDILLAVAAALQARQDEILAANAVDVSVAESR
jgi:delta-1-pyrroline-5-carboxylate synthetase